MDNEALLKRARHVANRFLDSIQGAGVVVSNEPILREALVSNMTVETDLPRQFGAWVARGRQRGVTFYVSAAGVDRGLLEKAFVDAYLTDDDARHFLANLREEPAGEIQQAFRARAQG